MRTERERIVHTKRKDPALVERGAAGIACALVQMGQGNTLLRLGDAIVMAHDLLADRIGCLLYTSPSPRD